jgi:hypothetical protein
LIRSTSTSKIEYAVKKTTSQHKAYNPPDSAIESLARGLLPVIQAYFDSEQGQREFMAWKERKSEITKH